MFHSIAQVGTEHGSRYLTRLCRHWSHKFDIAYDAGQARIPFGADQLCTLHASPTVLRIEIAAPDQGAVERLERVLADHLVRMADRDNLGAFDWVRDF